MRRETRIDMRSETRRDTRSYSRSNTRRETKKIYKERPAGLWNTDSPHHGNSVEGSIVVSTDCAIPDDGRLQHRGDVSDIEEQKERGFAVN